MVSILFRSYIITPEHFFSFSFLLTDIQEEIQATGETSGSLKIVSVFKDKYLAVLDQDSRSHIKFLMAQSFLPSKFTHLSCGGGGGGGIGTQNPTTSHEGTVSAKLIRGGQEISFVDP